MIAKTSGKQPEKIVTSKDTEETNNPLPSKDLQKKKGRPKK